MFEKWCFPCEVDPFMNFHSYRKVFNVSKWFIVFVYFSCFVTCMLFYLRWSGVSLLVSYVTVHNHLSYITVPLTYVVLCFGLWINTRLNSCLDLVLGCHRTSFPRKYIIIHYWPLNPCLVFELSTISHFMSSPHLFWMLQVCNTCICKATYRIIYMYSHSILMPLS